MQDSSRKEVPNHSHMFYDQPHPEPGSYYRHPMSNLDQGLYSNDGILQNHLSAGAFKQYYNFESSSGTSSHPPQNSSSSVSFTSNGSPSSNQECHSYPLDPYHSPDNNCGSPISRSCLTDDVDDLRHKIRELETAMLGPDPDRLDIYSITNPVNPVFPAPEVGWKHVSDIISRKDLKEVLCACAQAIGENDMLTVEWLVSELRKMVSVSGEPIQRLGAYMLEALVARSASSGSAIYKSLRCKEPAPGPELLSYMHILYEVCPYFKFGYLSANGAIAEAVKGDSRVHIIDFQITQGNQWITLMQALAKRPGGPPQITITGIDDSTSAYARGGGLDIVAKRLSALAQSLRVPFEFHGIAASPSELQLEDLKVRSGDAVAVNFALMLHHMPDESVGSQNHRDRLLRLVKSLSPKVVTLVEQESNTNTAPFLPRFLETLKYYTAVFESIDVTLPREHKERINVEQHCLARDIVNIIACEGAERVERHELLGKWKSRFLMAGFKPYPLSSYVNATIEALLKNYCEKYTLEERDGALYLGWLNQNLVTSSAWI